ncbi:hypothetical protein L2703_00220 [Shewanella basaltis]|uniref:hypothetical protein n=1 Tax=Shewanella basaltis TaxID=472183 RepID=UPI00200EA6CE|nr:hypothetical protein [Shewanella basaltis]MCL1112041.1 hypothetical protein [Shewanella basaltis]
MNFKLLVVLSLFITPATFASELEKMAEEDQLARSGDYEKIDWLAVAKDDQIRRNRVKEILSDNRAFTAKDYYSAALIMQHGKTPEDYLAAFQYAKKAKDIDPKDEGAAWLSCAAEDRYLLKVNKKQVWGTQLESKLNKVGTYEILYLIDFDETQKSDAEREGCFLPSLKEMKRRLNAMSKMKNINMQFEHWMSGT